ASIAALIAWGFAPSRSTSACASAAGAAAANCALQVSVSKPVFSGTVENPTNASVTWSVTNLPPCYTISESEVTFTVNRNNKPSVAFKKTISGSATTTTVSLSSLGTNLSKGFQPNTITAEVRVTATADPKKTATEANSKTL